MQVVDTASRLDLSRGLRKGSYTTSNQSQGLCERSATRVRIPRRSEQIVRMRGSDIEYKDVIIVSEYC